MSNITPQETPPQPARKINIDWLLPYRKHVAIGLLVFGLLFAAIPIWLGIRFGLGMRVGPLFIFGALLALVNFVVGGIGLGYTPDGSKMTESEHLRLLLLSAGALIGLGTALLGFALPFTVYQEQWINGLQSWREHPWALIWPVAALLGGLGLMFVSLQLGRGMERENQRIRQLLYGFNAVLMSVLLVALLAIPNVLAYAAPFTRFFGRPFDWTATDVNAISPAMRNLLADLKEPVKVYLLLPRSTVIAADSQTLLDNCRSLSNNFSWELIDPRAAANRTRIVGFMEKYALSDPQGMLIIRGVESEKSKSDHTFIKARDLYSQESVGGRGGALSYSFQGENALYQALLDLIEGKLVLYFTQGHGELSLDAAPPGMPRMRPQQGSDLATLKQKLTERKSVEVKPLTVDRNLKQVPDDANVVIVARPTQPFTPQEAKVLRDYVKRPAKTRTVKGKDGRERTEEDVAAGRMMFLFNPVIQNEGGKKSMVPTGLESLLAEYNVKLGNDRILTVSRRDPLEVVAVTNPSSPNPVAKAFHPGPQEQTVFLFRNVRTVEPLGQRPGGPTVERLMLVPSQYGFWAETDLDASPTELASKLRDNEELAMKKIQTKPLCLAVCVSESAGGAPRDMAHASLLKETPRMVVFGAADWITDEGLAGGRGTTRMDLFNSLIAWEREKTALGATIPPKTRKEYQPNIPPQELWRLTWLPFFLMLLGVVGMGAGVWVVRRR